jgi:hypothetical protein
VLACFTLFGAFLPPDALLYGLIAYITETTPAGVGAGTEYLFHRIIIKVTTLGSNIFSTKLTVPAYIGIHMRI